jgi:hypothetical protein
MSTFPLGLDIDALPGPTRGVSPALYVRDEVVLSPAGDWFALAYTIFEASICNEVGHVAWGQVVNGSARIQENPPGLIAICWYRPWCVWLHPRAFVFKTQRYSRGRLYMPLPTRFQAIGDGKALFGAIEGDA